LGCRFRAVIKELQGRRTPSVGLPFKTTYRVTAAGSGSPAAEARGLVDLAASLSQPAKGGHRLGVAGLGGSVERLPSEPMAEPGQPTTFGHPSAIKADQRKHGQGDPSSSIEAGC
jgi:hypothetical protein